MCNTSHLNRHSCNDSYWHCAKMAATLTHHSPSQRGIYLCNIYGHNHHLEHECDITTYVVTSNILLPLSSLSLLTSHTYIYTNTHTHISTFTIVTCLLAVATVVSLGLLLVRSSFIEVVVLQKIFIA